LLSLLLSLGVAAPSHAQQQKLLDLDPTQPIEGLTRADIDAVGPERLLCRNMVSGVNDLIALLQRSPDPNKEFQSSFDKAKSRWPGNRGRCDAAIGDLEEGWPRSVLRDEFERVMALWTALIGVAQAHVEGAPPKDIETAIDNYQAELDRWRLWLDASLDFWGGTWLAEPLPPSCLAEASRRSDAIAKKIWLNATLPTQKRLPEDLEDIDIRIKAEQKTVKSCNAEEPLAQIQLNLLQRRLDVYVEGLGGLRQDDDEQIRRAMDAEQRLVARSMRCRQEYENGTPSAVCRPEIK